MAWLQRLNDPLRHAPADTLGETYAALLERLGPVAPFELAALGGRAMATPGLAFLVGYQAALRVLWPSAPASNSHVACSSSKRPWPTSGISGRVGNGSSVTPGSPG